MSEPSDVPLKTVPLDAEHRRLGGRMVEFSGYSLPVQYPTGIVAEHKWTREHAGLFDVSHMGPSFLELTDPTGDADADHFAIAAVVEPLIPGDIRGLKHGQLRYTLLLNDEGGTRDDLMIGRSPRFNGALYVIVNAGTKEADFSIIQQAAEGKASFHRADDGVLLALQGPQAADVMAAFLPEAVDLGFMSYYSYEWQGARLIVSRSGYTGEDGFEILAPATHGEKLWQALLGDERVKPIGLGARDSLRLEAGLPLYGHDLDDTVSPIEAGLGFAVSKRRREAADFPGARRILDEAGSQELLERVRVGLFVEGAPARENAPIVAPDGTAIGRVTSGGFSPSLNRAIALGFVPPQWAAPGTRLQVAVRGKLQAAEIVPTPFVPHRYVRKAKA